jgi:hypothetical protein
MDSKVYSTPKLVEYGRVEDITQGPWGGSFDACTGLTNDADGGYNPFGKPQSCPWTRGS